MARYGLRAPRAGTALLLILMMYVSGVHGISQESSSMRALRRLAEQNPSLFANGAQGFHEFGAKARERAGKPPGGVPEADGTHAHLTSHGARRAAEEVVDATHSRARHFASRRLVAALFEAHAEELREGDAHRDYVPHDEAKLVEMAGYVHHPMASRGEKVAHVLALAHHTARHKAALHLRGEVDAHSDDAHPSTTMRGPGEPSSFTEAGSQVSVRAREGAAAGKGINLWLMAVLGLLQGILTIFFGKENFFSFKACAYSFSEGFAKSEGRAKFTNAMERFGQLHHVPPTFTNEEIFNTWARPINSIYKFHAPDATPLWFRYLGPRDLSKYTPAQQRDMADHPEKMPACWEWTPYSSSSWSDRVWIKTPTMTVPSGSYEGQKPVEMNRGLIKYLHTLCPSPPLLDAEDVGRLLGPPLLRTSGGYSYYRFEAPGVGWFSDEVAYYRHTASAGWQWTRTGPGNHRSKPKWTSVRERATLPLDHKHVAKYLAEKKPTPDAVSHYHLALLGEPNVGPEWYEYAADGCFFRKNVKNPALAWQVSTTGASFKNVLSSRPAPERLDRLHKLLYEYLAAKNPKAPSALEQNQHHGDLRSAFNPNTFLKRAERIKNAFVQMVSAIPGWVGDAVGSFFKCFGEVKERCFGTPKETDAEVEAAAASRAQLEAAAASRVADGFNAGEAVDDHLARRDLFGSVGITKESATAAGWSDPATIEMYYTTQAGGPHANFLELNGTAAATPEEAADAETDAALLEMDAAEQELHLDRAIDAFHAAAAEHGHPWMEGDAPAPGVYQNSDEHLDDQLGAMIELLGLEGVEPESLPRAAERASARARNPKAAARPAGAATLLEAGARTDPPQQTTAAELPAASDDDVAVDDAAERAALLAELEALSAAYEPVLEDEAAAEPVETASFSKNEESPTAGDAAAEAESGLSALDDLDLDSIDISDISLETLEEVAAVLGEAEGANKCEELKGEQVQGVILTGFAWGIVAMMALWRVRKGMAAGVRATSRALWNVLNKLTLNLPRHSIAGAKTLGRHVIVMSKATGVFLLRTLHKIVSYMPKLRALWTATWNAIAVTYKSLLAAMKSAGAKTAAWAAKNARALGGSRAVQAVATRANALMRSTVNGGAAAAKVLADAAVAARTAGKTGLRLLKGTRLARVGLGVARALSGSLIGRSLSVVLRGIAWIGARLGVKIAALATPGALFVVGLYTAFIGFNVWMNWKEITECVRDIGAMLEKGRKLAGSDGLFAALGALNGSDSFDLFGLVGRLLVKIFI